MFESTFGLFRIYEESFKKINLINVDENIDSLTLADIAKRKENLFWRENFEKLIDLLEK